uniref:Uncharacterized protein n=1 Tax=Physcomitrium patens TaxID=3218 RepID=A0A2K1LAX5_PHYPA|nr:hypothetical protein PHYPA_001588 [Physcomitrium patens]
MYYNQHSLSHWSSLLLATMEHWRREFEDMQAAYGWWQW